MLIAVGIIAFIILYSVYGGIESTASVINQPSGFIPEPENNPAPVYVPEPLMQMPEVFQNMTPLPSSQTVSEILAGLMSYNSGFVPPPDNNPVPAVDSYNVNPPPDKLLSPASVSFNEGSGTVSYNINQA